MEFRSPYRAPYQTQSRESWSEWQDLNLRPPRPERGVLPDYAVFGMRKAVPLRGEVRRLTQESRLCHQLPN